MTAEFFFFSPPLVKCKFNICGIVTETVRFNTWLKIGWKAVLTSIQLINQSLWTEICHCLCNLITKGVRKILVRSIATYSPDNKNHNTALMRETVMGKGLGLILCLLDNSFKLRDFLSYRNHSLTALLLSPFHFSQINNNGPKGTDFLDCIQVP